MDDEKLEKAKELKQEIGNISDKLSAFRDVGKKSDPHGEQYPKYVTITGRGNYRAEDVISKTTLATIRRLIISELEEILSKLEQEYKEL